MSVTDENAAVGKAESVIKSADPLLCVEQAIGEMGYGGDRTPVLLTYLALTSRVLAIRHGQMPVHLLITGPPSAGKSYTLQTALRLFPEGTCHVIDAGSQRVILYWNRDLQHRALIFSEADSLPAGEDNPAASALRGLLQDNRLHYQYVDRNARAGDDKVVVVDKPGPTVLVTTSTKLLGPQLVSRMFVLSIGDDVERVRASLRAQAAIELRGARAPDDALCAYQGVLQDGAPWDVTVPFAEELAEAIGRGALPSRICRDFSRLLCLIKSVTDLPPGN